MKKAEIRKLDRMWSLKIRERDQNKCQVCGMEGNNPHHIVGRRNRTLRWDLNNGITLCPGCHTFRTKSAHQDPLWFADWFRSNHPSRYRLIKHKKESTIKATYNDVLEEYL